MLGWHHRSNGHELEQTLGDDGGRGTLVCCSPCSPTHRVGHSLATEQQQQQPTAAACMVVGWI